MSRKNLIILVSVGLLVVAVTIFGGIMNSALDTVVLAPGAPGVHYGTEEYL